MLKVITSKKLGLNIDKMYCAACHLVITDRLYRNA